MKAKHPGDLLLPCPICHNVETADLGHKICRKCERRPIPNQNHKGHVA